MRETALSPARRRRLLSLAAALTTGAVLGYAGLAIAGHEHLANLWYHGQGYGDVRNGTSHSYLGSSDRTSREGYVQIAKNSGYAYPGEITDIARHIHAEIRHSVDQCIWRAHVRSPQTSLPHHDGHGCH